MKNSYLMSSSSYFCQLMNGALATSKIAIIIIIFIIIVIIIPKILTEYKQMLTFHSSAN